MKFRVAQIDHVELTVPDRFAAADWYQRILGLEVVPQYREWSDDPRGPLMVATPEGQTKLALFEGEPQGSQRNRGFHLVAFRVTGEEFLEFVASTEDLPLLDRHGTPVTASSVVDHRLAFSIYFCDPWKNELEITTYDVELVRDRLAISPPPPDA